MENTKDYLYEIEKNTLQFKISRGEIAPEKYEEEIKKICKKLDY